MVNYSTEKLTQQSFVLRRQTEGASLPMRKFTIKSIGGLDECFPEERLQGLRSTCRDTGGKPGFSSFGQRSRLRMQRIAD
ncbi:hypothetical protein AB0L39_33760 [Streptomyces parvus]|uniref:hypothetical protein n=1 Tax=Streptomyces parvus TaxID=66428 RepID=UPI00344A95AD